MTDKTTPPASPEATSPTEVTPTVTVTPDPSVPGVTDAPTAEEAVAAARAKRLQYAVLGIVVVCAAMFATLGMPWSQTTSTDTVIELPDGTTAALQTGTVTLPGRDVGGTAVVMIAVVLGAVAAVSIYRRLWWGAAATLMVMLSQSMKVSQPGPRGAVGAPTPGSGLVAMQALWWALAATVALGAVQAYLVRKAEKDAQAAASGTESPVAGVLARMVGAAVKEGTKKEGTKRP